MATEIWLGPAGSEVLLPPVNWISGAPGEYPESYKKNFESATMLDGKLRYNFVGHSQRSWTLDWAMLEKSDIDILQGLADLRQSLRFNNGMTPTKTWRAVAVKSFIPSILQSTVGAGRTAYYKATMALEEEN